MNSSTATSYSLASKILLALASIASYALFASIDKMIRQLEAAPDMGSLFIYIVGAIFGGCVLMPYVGAERRALRIAALWVAGAVIYRLAVEFAMEVPLDNPLVIFIVTGAGAAVLCALAVILLAPQPWRPLALVFALVAGALGGASFQLQNLSDPFLLVGHGCWQFLVCLALHAGFDRRPPA